MLYILFCILFSTLILIFFKIATRYKVDIFIVILINYVLAGSLGWILSYPIGHSFQEIFQVLPWAAVIGILFILLFFLVGKTTEKSGMAITAIATKMSVVFPVLYSMIAFNEESSLLKILGIALALMALYLVVFKRNAKRINYAIIMLPLLLFLGNGILDSVLKFTQHYKIAYFDIFLFNALVFTIALVVGLLFLPFRNRINRKTSDAKTWVLGIAVGLVNFGSLFSMVKALNSSIDSSLVFMFNNTGVVLATSLVGYFIFREKLSKTNISGILVALAALVLMSLQINGST